MILLSWFDLNAFSINVHVWSEVILKSNYILGVLNTGVNVCFRASLKWNLNWKFWEILRKSFGRSRSSVNWSWAEYFFLYVDAIEIEKIHRNPIKYEISKFETNPKSYWNIQSRRKKKFFFEISPWNKSKILLK